MWLKVEKKYQGGSKIDYLFSEKEISEEKQKEWAENWAKYTAGGHNYGYSCNYEIVKKPSNEFLSDKIRSLKNEKDFLEKEIIFYSSFLEEFI